MPTSSPAGSSGPEGHRGAAPQPRSTRGHPPEAGHGGPSIPTTASRTSPTEKGCAFDAHRATCGRPKFDAFLRKYFDTHAFTSMTTEDFLAYLDEELLQPEQVRRRDKWVYQAGLPDDPWCPPAMRSRRWGGRAGTLTRAPGRGTDTKGWTTFQWMHFLRHLPDPMTHEQLDRPDGPSFTAGRQLRKWWPPGWSSACARLRARLHRLMISTTVGWRKFLVPLYTAMVATEKGKVMANTIMPRPARTTTGLHPYHRRPASAGSRDVAPISLDTSPLK